MRLCEPAVPLPWRCVAAALKPNRKNSLGRHAFTILNGSRLGFPAPSSLPLLSLPRGLRLPPRGDDLGPRQKASSGAVTPCIGKTTAPPKSSVRRLSVRVPDTDGISAAESKNSLVNSLRGPALFW